MSSDSRTEKYEFSFPDLKYEVETYKYFQKKIEKFSKFQKYPKSFPKVSKRVLNMFWVEFLEKQICPVFHGESSLGNFQENQKKYFKCAKFQKCSTVFWTWFGVIFLKYFFCRVFLGESSLEKFQKNQKYFKFSKMSIIVPKSTQTCFEHDLGWFFRKKILSQCSKKLSFRKISKHQKFFKFPKLHKIVPKSAQLCFEHALGWFCWNIFLPSVPWRVEASKKFKKNLTVQNIYNYSLSAVWKGWKKNYIWNTWKDKSIMIMPSFYLQKKWLRVIAIT